MTRSEVLSFCGLMIPPEYAACGSEEAANVDLLHKSVLEAVDSVQSMIRSDLRRTETYTMDESPLQSIAGKRKGESANGSIKTSSLSIFADCALPLVERYGQFLRNFVGDDVEVNNLPFAAVAEKSARILWNPGLLRPLTWWLSGYDSQLRYLARLNWQDDIWDDNQEWVRAFGGGLMGYLKDLFSGKFTDRNGKKTQFDVDVDLTDFTRLDKIQLSPEVAGSVVSVMVEYLGDRLFKVPYYSSAILSKYREYRTVVKRLELAKAHLDELQEAVECGVLDKTVAKRVKLYGQAGEIKWGVLERSEQAKSKNGDVEKSTILASLRSRLVVRAFEEQDDAVLSAIRSKHASKLLLDTIEEEERGQHKLQTAFTCYKHSVIGKHLADIFLADKVAEYGTKGRDKDTGRKSDAKPRYKDYSDLIGILTGFGGATAEKNIRSLFGGAIRGLSLVSLDNEVVAELISAAAATIAKKAMEAVVYKAVASYVTSREGEAQTKREFLTVLAKFHEEVSEDT